LKDQHGEEHRLSDFRGMKVLLSFHPLAWTPVCTKQMQSLEENRNQFDELNTVPLGLSVDSFQSKKAWAENIGVNDTLLLADFWPHGEFAQTMGLFMPDKGISQRANVIIDGEGKVIFIKVYPIKELPDINEIIDFIKIK